jgi:hypothetical protein
MVQLWKWFTGWAEGFGIVVPPADGPLVYRLVSAKLTAQIEEEGLTLASLCFSHPIPLSTYAAVHRYFFLTSLMQN